MNMTKNVCVIKRKAGTTKRLGMKRHEHYFVADQSVRHTHTDKNAMTCGTESNGNGE